MLILSIVLIYFLLLLAISRWTGRNATNQSFYRADRRSPWYMVAFGMVGASISGVTFVSVPGMVIYSKMTYLQMCMGFILGYVIVAFVLLPLYYRLNLTSIYGYLLTRFGKKTYKTGASFFLLSKMMGASIRFFVVCIILQRFVFDHIGIPFVVTAISLVALIWLYTRRGGIKTLVWTDSLQTICLFTALLLIIYKVTNELGLSVSETMALIGKSDYSQVFVFDDWVSRQNFLKQFASGVFIVLVMTGLDQDMMQKNLTCKSLGEAQKDMCSYGIAFLPANLMFLSLGILIIALFQQTGQMVPSSGDELLPMYVSNAGTFIMALFTLGIVSASFSSADSALTSMTTIFCVDIKERLGDERLRKRVHLLMCAVFVLFILLFRIANSTSLIDAVYVIASYTYGPLLGLFSFGMLTKRKINDNWSPYIALASPVLCFAIDYASGYFFGYRFGYELLMLNGLFTFLGLWASRSRES